MSKPVNISNIQLLSPSTDLPLSILPIVRQHVSDAAFYWGQITNSEFSALQNQQNILDFQYYLNANLDGLSAAGECGWQEAFKALKRWKTQGEAFVCGFLAHQSQDDNYLKLCWELIKQSPTTTLEGYAAALAYLPYETVNAYLLKLQDSVDSHEICVLLRSLAEHQQILSAQLVRTYLYHPDSQVQAAACRYIQLLRLTEYLPYLYQLNSHDNLLVKYASAVALGWLDFNNQVTTNILQHTIESYLNAVPQKGLAALLHQQKLEELVRLAGQYNAMYSNDVQTSLEILPVYLQILYLGHYGHTEYLSYLQDLLDDNELGRLAFWAIHMITGLDIDESSYLLPSGENELTEQPINKRSIQLGIGIGKPNSIAIRAACQSLQLSTGAMLLGLPISESTCHKIVVQGRQVARSAASWHLARFNPQARLINISKISQRDKGSYVASA